MKLATFFKSIKKTIEKNNLVKFTPVLISVPALYGIAKFYNIVGRKAESDDCTKQIKIIGDTSMENTFLTDYNDV